MHICIFKFAGNKHKNGEDVLKMYPLIKNSWLSETIQYIELKFSDINNIPMLQYSEIVF